LQEILEQHLPIILLKIKNSDFKMDEYYNWQTKLTTFKGFVDNFQKGIV